MALGMFGGVLPLRNSPCPESAWGEKAYGYVVLHPNPWVLFTYIKTSISHGGGTVVCYRPNFPVCYQHPHLSRNQRQDRRRPLRNIIYASIRCYDMGLLVKYNGRWLAYADIRGEHVPIMALLPRSSFLCDDWCYFSALVLMVISRLLGVYKHNK